MKTGFESGTVTADLTTTVVYNYKSLRNDVKPRSLTQYMPSSQLHIICFCRTSLYGNTAKN